MRRALVVVLVLVLGATGCASPRRDWSPVPTPTQTQTPTVGGPTLRSLGFENGPTNLALPADLVVERAVDQPNVVSVFFTRPAPEQALAILRTNLPTAGFTVTQDGGGSLVFEGPEWTGAYTASDGLGALTLRRR